MRLILALTLVGSLGLFTSCAHKSCSLNDHGKKGSCCKDKKEECSKKDVEKGSCPSTHKKS